MNRLQHGSTPDRARPRRFHLAVTALLVLGAVFAVVGVPQVPSASAATPLPAHISRYVPLGPFRLADTRPTSGAFGFSRPVGTVYRVKIAGRFGVPLDATEAVVNVTAMATAGPGRAAVYAVGDPIPNEADVVADAKGQSVSNLVHVRLGIGGAIDIRRTVGMQVAVDLQGVYVPVTGPVSDGRLTTYLTGSKRVFAGGAVSPGGNRLVDMSSVVPEGAKAAVITLSVDRANPGSFTVYADGASRTPTWSLVTDKANQARSNQVIVPLKSTNRRIRVFSSKGARVTVDVLGYYTGSNVGPSTVGLFIPTHHLRRLDKMTGRPLPPLGPVTFEFSPGTSMSVSAVVGNILQAGAWDPGIITAKPAGIASSSVVVSSTSTWPQSVSSHFLARTSTRGIAITSKVGAFMVVDVAGWFYGPRPTATQKAVVNRTLKPTFVNAVRWTDRYGTHGLRVKYRADDNLDAIANSGVGASYHNLSSLLRAGNVMVFGHRTEHGGPFRNLNAVKMGATFSLRGIDGHWFNYRVVYIGVTQPTYSSISNITRYFRPVTAQLVACSNPDGTPTSLKYRITITGRLISVT